MKDGKITLDFLRDIILHELELEEEQVVIYNQKWNIPKDDRLYVVLEYNGTPRVLSNRSVFNSDTNQEEQNINTQESIVIGLFSRGLEAIKRKEEVLMALVSIYSQQFQEANSFEIAQIAPIQNLTELEETAHLYRFDIPVNVLAWYEKKKDASFYDSFKIEVRTEDVKEEIDQPTTDPAA